MGLMKFSDDLVDIGERAGKEYQIETMLQEMQMQWESVFFNFLTHKTSKIVRGYDDI